MIKCISQWSVRGSGDGTRSMDEIFAEVKAAGFAGIELTIGFAGNLTPETDEATCRSYREAAARHGLVVETLASGMTWGCSPTNPDPAVRGRAVEIHRRALERAGWLGCRAMLFVPGAVRIPWDDAYGPVRYDQAVGWAGEAVAALLPAAEQAGVDLCVENVWNGMFYSPLELAAFVDGFAHPRLGVYLDVGNLLGLHQYPPHWIEILDRRIRRVHLKDFQRSVGGLAGFCDLLAGDVPYPEVMAALRAVGYDATVVAEMMPPDPTLLERTNQALDRILAM